MEEPRSGGRTRIHLFEFALPPSRIWTGVAVGVVVAAASFALTVMVKQHVAQNAPPTSRRADLIDRILAAEAEQRQLSGQIARMRERIAALERGSAQGNEELERLNRELEEVRFLAGLTEAVGPGVEIVLEDAVERPAEGAPQDYLVHDYDLREIVNGLLASGAEGIAINGERVTAVSAIRCVGPTILVNARRIASPFRILAVGDPDELERGVAEDGPSAELFTRVFPTYGIRWRITTAERVELPRYQRELTLDAAKVVGR